MDDLRKIAILRRIKSYDNLSREDLIYSILRSGRHPKERNYMQQINNNTDDKIKAKINNIRLAIARLGDKIPKKHRDIGRKDFYEIEKK